MTDKPKQTRQAKHRQKMIEAGYFEARPWIPDTPRDRQEIYARAAAQRERFERQRGK